MAEKLQVYNLALAHLKERKLASLTENREPRRVLDDLWDQVAAECLTEASWNHCIRTIEIEADTSLTPAFGYAYAFRHPDDWSRTVEIASEPTFVRPLTDLRDEGGYWYANLTPIYVRYLSDDPTYGMDLSRWGARFTAWVSFKLAEYGCSRITGSDELLRGPEGIVRRGNKAKLKAKSIDAMDEPPRRPPTGSWVNSRRGGASGQPQPGGDMYDD